MWLRIEKLAGSRCHVSSIRESLRETKIEQLDRALRRDLDVGGLQIAMDHAAVVRLFERSGHLQRDLPGLIERQWTPGRIALHQLHDQCTILHSVVIRLMLTGQPLDELSLEELDKLTDAARYLKAPRKPNRREEAFSTTAFAQ